MKINLTSFFLGIATTFVFWLFLFQKGCVSEKEIQHTTDTIYVDKPYKEIVIKEVEKPVKIYVYNTDTVYRKQIEKDTLITFVEMTPWMAKVHTISPLGIPSVKEYPMLDFKKVQINHQGNTFVKLPKYPKLKKRLKILGQIGLFVGGVYCGKNLLNKS